RAGTHPHGRHDAADRADDGGRQQRPDRHPAQPPLPRLGAAAGGRPRPAGVPPAAAYHRPRGTFSRGGSAMGRLIRMDSSGHSTLAEWSAQDEAAYQAAVEAFRRELDQGYIGVVSEGEGHATQVRELPEDAELVIMRRPIAGG